MEQYDYSDDYNLDKLQMVMPMKRAFQMYVTPRYIDRYLDHPYEEFTADLVLAHVDERSVFIDIGANFGFFTLLVGSKFRRCKVLSFEPVDTNLQILKRNLELNSLDNVTPYNYAISDNRDKKEFCIMEASDSCGFNAHPRTRILQKVIVQSVTLDEFIGELSEDSCLIKVDTEGHEIAVLDGMKEVLSKKNVKLIIEFNPTCLKNAGFYPVELLQKLDQLNFDIYVIHDSSRLLFKLNHEDIQHWENSFFYGNSSRTSLNLFCVRKERSLSVCLFSHSSFLAGAERSFLELTKELIEDYGVACTAILPKEGPLYDKLKEVGAAIHIMNYSWWCDFGFDNISVAQTQFALSAAHCIEASSGVLSRINPDVVLSHSLVIPWGAIAAAMLGKPHVWYVSEFGELDHGLKFYYPFSEIIKLIESSSNLILTNSNAVKKTLFAESTNIPIETVYRYIELPNLVDSGQEIQYFRRTGSIKLAMIGTISERKGQKDAIMAAGQLAGKHIDIELAIAGYCPLPAYLTSLEAIVRANQLEEIVRIYDFQPNVTPLLVQADVVLVCSMNEAFGRVAVEAMLLKKPVIGTRSGGTLEIVIDECNGLLYEPGNYKVLADKIEYLIRNPEKINEFGLNGYEFVMTNFSKGKYGGRVYDLCQRIKGEANNALRFQSYGEFLERFLKCTGEELAKKERQLSECQQNLDMITDSNGWRILLKLYKIRDYCFPLQTLRGRVIRRLWQVVRKLLP